MSKVQIIPAILPKDYSQLENQVEDVSQNTDCVQVDICDGQFVPNATWPYKKHDNNFEQLLSEQKGLPHWEEIDFEFDLMVNKPEEIVEDWIIAGAKRIVLHTDFEKAVEILSGRVELGLAIEIDSPLETILPYADKVQFIQCMGIGNVGFQGQHFDSKVIDKIKEIRKVLPEMIISVDGGVSLENAQDLISAGASRLVVGSAIFNSDNFIETLEKFKRV
jgi:ribulose-phosphate 3-epimerase